jgi:hypothetical protein
MIRKFQFDEEKGLNLPVPSQVVFNEEFVPPPQTVERQRVEQVVS